MNVGIGEPGVFELADIKAELLNHRLEAGNPQLCMRVLEVDFIVAVIVGKEIGNRQMSETNPSIGPFVSI